MANTAAPTWTAEDRAIVALVDETLRRGRQLRTWFDDEARTRESRTQWFPVARTFDPDERFLGLFGQAQVDGKPVGVMGAHQDILFDRPRTAPGGVALEPLEYTCQSIREFALGYYLRLAETRSFARVEDGPSEPLPRLLDLLSWRRDKGVFGPSITLMKEDGFGFQQLYYKRTGSGEIGKFPESQQANIVDMREVGVKYDWLVLKTLVLNADMTVAPFGWNTPQLRLPVPMSSYLVLDRGFIDDQSELDGDVHARYGVGYALVKYDPSKSPIAYGPGHFDEAIQMNRFEVLKNGQVRARLTLVGNQPKAMMNLFGFDPVFGYISLMNLLSGGLASEKLSINREQVVKFILFNHCSWVFNSLMMSFRAYHQVPDWLDRATFPEWIRNKTAAPE